MKDHLPFQARWTVKVLQWLLSREVSLEEMLQDEDVLAGVVTYLTKKVSVEQEVPGLRENQEKVSSMEKELDFVRCRLQGADQQRKNEVLDLENRNSELREEVVKLTHKIRAIEKEKLDAQFASSGTKAAMKKMEEELRELRKKLEATEQELALRTGELEKAQAQHLELRQELDQIHANLARSEKELSDRIHRQTSHWEDEKSRLLFMLEERDNALSEAREGQAAATREIVSVTRDLEDNLERLALLEVEAVQKGVPMVKVGGEPVVGEKAARAVAEKKRLKEEDTPAPKSARRRSSMPDFDPISAVVGFSTADMFELSDDARYTEKVNLDVESIPEPNTHPVRDKTHSGRKESAAGKDKEAPKAARKTAKPGKTTEKAAKSVGKTPPQVEKPAKPVGKTPPQVEKPAKPVEKTPPQVEKPAKPVEKTPPQVEKTAKPVEKTPPQVEKTAKPVEKTVKPVEKPAQPQGQRPAQPQGQRPAQPQGQRPAQPQGQRPAQPQGQRPAQPQGGQPAQPGGNSRSRRSRPHRRPRHSPGGSPP